MFFNPAGLTQIWADDPSSDLRASIGVQLIIPRSTQKDTGSTISTVGTGGAFVPYDGRGSTNPIDPTPVPYLYLAKWLANGNAAVAFGLNFPFGLDTRSSSDWFGRYDAIEAALRTVNLTFVGAYRILDQLSIGGGLDVQYAHAKLITAVPNPLVPDAPTAATDARAETTGDARTLGFNVGLLFTLDEDTRFGAHYRSAMKHRINGSTTTSGFPQELAALNTTVGAHVDLRLPAIATVGVWRKVTRKVAVMGEFEWYGWSTFDEIRTRFDAPQPDVVRLTRYRDTFAVAVGFERRAEGSPLGLRGGIKYDRTPTVDGFRDTTFPDADRLWLGLGASYRISRHANLDFAFNHVFFRRTVVSVTREFPGVYVNQVSGDSHSVVNTVAMGFTWAF